MPYTTLQLPSDPAEAVNELRTVSRAHPVLVFKQSPICPTSRWAEDQCRAWLSTRADTVETALAVAWINVIDEKPLARGLTAELGIQHESPQALLFREGELVWHDSHMSLTADAFTQKVDN